MHDPDSDFTICNINANTPPPIYKSWNPLPSFESFRSVLIELEANGVLNIDNASTDGRNHFAFISANDNAWVDLLSEAIHARAAKLKDEARGPGAKCFQSEVNYVSRIWALAPP